MALTETQLPRTPQENLVNEVYTTVDEATACELEQLFREQGLVPTCQLGCSHCCRFHILANIAEAHTLVQYLKRELSDIQMEALRQRTKQWHEWDNSRPGRMPSGHIRTDIDISQYEHICPLLVQGECLAYPVRPMVCRTHFVSSPACLCDAINDPESTDEPPRVLDAIVIATEALALPIQESIEQRDWTSPAP